MSDSGGEGGDIDAYLIKMKREGKGKELDLNDDLGSSDDSSGENVQSKGETLVIDHVVGARRGYNFSEYRDGTKKTS